MRTINTSAGVLGDDVRGSGEAAILFNHSSASSLSWRELFVEALAERLLVVTIDYRGTGYSSLGTAPFSLLDLAADGRALLREVGVDRAMIVGASMGGAVSQEFALAFPEQVSALVLMGTFDAQSHFVAAWLFAARIAARAADAKEGVRQLKHRPARRLLGAAVTKQP